MTGRRGVISTEVTEHKEAGIRPLEREGKFRSLCDLSPVGIFLTDTEGYCTYTNQRLQLLCGFASEEGSDERWAQIVHPADREEVFGDWSVYAGEGQEYSRELNFQLAPGAIRWIHVRTAPIFSKEGVVIGHSGMAEDITERKERELALHESESKYRTLMEQASDGIHTYDFKGNFIDANAKLCEMLGYTREDLLRLNVENLIPAEDLAAAPLRFGELRAGETIISERLVRRKDGTLLPVEISGKMLPSGALQAIVRDITKRKQSEEAIRFQAHLLDTVEQAVIATDLSGTIIYWNRFAEKLYGWPAAEIIGRNIIEVTPSQAEQEQASEVMSRLQAGQSWSGQFKVQRRDGTTFPAFITDTPIYNEEGTMVGIVGISSDITERKLVEDLLRGLSSKLERQLQTFDTVMSSVQDFVYIFDLSGRFTYINKPLLNLWQKTFRQAVGKNFYELDYPQDLADKLQRQIQEVILTSRPVKDETLYTNGSGTRAYEYIFVPLITADGAVEAVAGVTRDITEHKRAEEALRESEEWLRAIFEASRDGIIVEDDERIIYVNQSYTDLFGYDGPGELIGKHVSTLISPEDVERMLEFGKQRAQGKPVASIYEFKGKRKDGSLIDVEASVSTSIIAGQAYITTIIRDIAERMQAEKSLRQAHDELERRVTQRTIELANTNETLQAEIRERTRMAEARRQLLQQLVTAQEDERRRISRELHDQMGQHLAAIVLLVNSLKDFPQLETATNTRFEQLEEVAHQISREVDTLAWELRPTVLDDLGLHAALGNHLEKWSKRSGVPVDFHSTGLADRRLPPQMETAIYRLAQEALTNIIKHAQATNVGFILERRGNQVSVIIDDDGCGFDVEALLATPAGERRMGVLGMQERTTLVGGTLNIESTPGAGTTIFVHIPLTHAADEGNHHE